jgi:hypothetical protein
MFKSLWYKFWSSRLVVKVQAIWYILRGKGVAYRVKFKGGLSCIDPDGTLILESHFLDAAAVEALAARAIERALSLHA